MGAASSPGTEREGEMTEGFLEEEFVATEREGMAEAGRVPPGLCPVLWAIAPSP